MMKKISAKYSFVAILFLALSVYPLAAHAESEYGDMTQSHPELVAKYQAKADAEAQAQGAQVNAQIQQEVDKAKAGGYSIDINGQIYGASNPTQSWNGTQTQNITQSSGVSAGPTGGTSLLPTPKTLNGETVGLSGFTPASTTPTEVPKEEWPTDRIEKARQINAEGLAKFKEHAKTEGRELTTDEIRLAACRLDIQNRVYSNPSLKKPTPEEIEKEALKQVEEWKRENRYMLPDGNVASFGPGGIAGWVQSEREFREKFLQETHATAERLSKGVVQGLTAEQHAWEEKARLGTLKTQAELEKSMREESEKKIAQMLKDTGVADPGVYHSTVSKPSPVTYAPPKTLVSYEKDKAK